MFVYLVRPYYPHWGAHAGIHQFIKHLDRARFKTQVAAVPMNDKGFLIPPLNKYISKKIQAHGTQAYRLGDFRAEMSTFVACLCRKVDLVHLLDAEHSLLFLPHWFRRFRQLKSFPKTIAMFHQPPSVLQSLVNIDIVRKVDYVLTVSPTQVSFFQSYLPSERIRMISHGVDTDYFKPKSERSHNGTLKCLAAGIWLRDYEAVIKTAKLLQDRREIEFHLVAQEMQVPPDLPSVRIHKNLSDSEMLRLYQTSDVLFMPLKSATANNVLLEGISCGLPVVSTDLASTRAYLPGPEAVLIKYNNPVAFAETLVNLHRDGQQRERMSASARRRALSLSWRDIAKEYERLYLEA